MQSRQSGGYQRDAPDPPRLRIANEARLKLLLAEHLEAQTIDEPDGHHPKHGLNQPGNQGTVSQHGPTTRQEQRIARRPECEMGNVSPIDDLVKCSPTDRSGEQPVVLGVGEDADSPRSPPLDVPLHAHRRRHAEEKGQLEDLPKGRRGQPPIWYASPG